MGRGIKDRTGLKYGRLTVTGYHSSREGKTYWNAICDCGGSFIARGDKLQTGKAKSCGCLMEENRRNNLVRMTKEEWKEFQEFRRSKEERT